MNPSFGGTITAGEADDVLVENNHDSWLLPCWSLKHHWCCCLLVSDSGLQLGRRLASVPRHPLSPPPPSVKVRHAININLIHMKCVNVTYWWFAEIMPMLFSGDLAEQKQSDDQTGRKQIQMI